MYSYIILLQYSLAESCKAMYEVDFQNCMKVNCISDKKFKTTKGSLLIKEGSQNICCYFSIPCTKIYME